jgi:imidazolonepropionase-like amidohydrolase
MRSRYLLLPALLALLSCKGAPSTQTQPAAATPATPATPATSTAPTADGLAITGGRLRLADGVMATRTIHIAGARIRAVDEAGPAPGERVIDVGGDVSGATLVPAFIDSHVHIVAAKPEDMLRGGVAAAVDLGALPTIWEDAPAMRPFRLYPAGQLITAPGGYPTQGWGRGGFGYEVAGVEAAARAATEMVERGAIAIKMPIVPEAGPILSAAEQRAVALAAHGRGLPVGSHAMSREAVAMALAAGVDILVHAPADRLDDNVVRAFCQRPRAAVIPTLVAFGASAAARDNARALRAAGCTLLYGTDMGNGVPPGISLDELLHYQSLGMTPAEVIDAATRVPAAYFGIRDLGAIAPGQAASFLAVDGDPYQDLRSLERRRLIVIEGQVIPQDGDPAQPE